MTGSKYVFVGLSGTAIALDRETGELMWATHLNGDDLVHLVLDGNYLFATTHGEIFCLEPMTGRVRWGNPLKGYGSGDAYIAARASVGAELRAVIEEMSRPKKAGAAGDTIFIN